jgi:hypothetical protein
MQQDQGIQEYQKKVQSSNPLMLCMHVVRLSNSRFLREPTKQHRVNEVRARSVKVREYYDIICPIRLGEC